ncbi:hypothetical protein B0H10DRAFT_2221515 [Mycena sp. CBHHK59/15]|nr:hypothetical protein B0H10DRAFT_2221515 [Mycena sp. CBHHK59/15]
MPAIRLSSRRGSAVGRRRGELAAISFAKPGTYGYTPPTSPGPSNVCAERHPHIALSPVANALSLWLAFAHHRLTAATVPTQRHARTAANEKGASWQETQPGICPRPPNSFMLFRADFIIANCWRALPLPEKHIWETKAKHAKAEHNLMYPDYKFRPVHNKRGAARSTSNAPPPSAQPVLRTASESTVRNQLTPQEDERRCEEVASLLLQGKKGEELAWAVRDLDSRRKAEFAQSSPSPVPIPYHHNSKFPHPLNLDPMYYPQVPSSPPSSSLTSSHASGSGAGSPYSLPMPLQHDNRDRSWRHRRSSSVPLPNDYSYTFPPFMYGEGNGMGITLPSPSTFSLPPPPSSSSDSLAGLPPSISGPGRTSFSFSFGAGAGAGARGSFSFAGAFGGTWGGNNNGPVGRRASSVQAFFSPSSFAQPREHAEEELLDADTDAVSPFGAAQQVVHAPQPVHAVSPLGVEFAEQAQQTEVQMAVRRRRRVPAEPYASHRPPSHAEEDPAAMSYADDVANGGSSSMRGSARTRRCTRQHHLDFASDLRSSIDMSTPASTYDTEMSPYDSYASESVQRPTIRAFADHTRPFRNYLYLSAVHRPPPSIRLPLDEIVST